MTQPTTLNGSHSNSFGVALHGGQRDANHAVGRHVPRHGQCDLAAGLFE
jgi:hypothetical protein